MLRPAPVSLACVVFALGASWAAHAAELVEGALSQVPILRRFAIEDGLPQSSVNAIIQSRDEYLWLGTFGGLVRFDGERFTTFRSLAGEGPSSDRVSALLEDQTGQLWIGTEDGGLTVRKDGQFERLSVCDGRCRVYVLLLQQGQVLASTTEGLFVIDAVTHRARVTSALRLISGAVDARGDAYFVGDAQLWRHDQRGLEAVPLPPTVGRIGIVRWLGDELWVAGDDKLFRQSKGSWLRVAGDRPWPAVRMLTKDAEGKVWVSDALGRTARVSASGKVEPAPLNAGTLVSTLMGSDGTLWFGSNARGLWRVRRPRVALLNDARSGFNLPGFAVTGDGAGGHWLGLNCAGVRHRDGQGRVRAWPLAPCAWSLDVAPAGRLWIGGTDGRLAYIDHPNASVQVAYTWASTELVRSVQALSDSELLVSAGETTSRLTISPAGKVTATELRPLSSMRIVRIVPSRSGGLWFVGDHGALRLVNDQVAERIDVAAGLSTRFVRALYEETDGTLLLGTYGGGLNVVRDGRVIRVHRESTGLFDDVVSCILEDSYGSLWLAGNRGLSSIGPAQRKALANPSIDVRRVGANEGLVPVETNGAVDPACHRDRDGRLWFPLLSGFAVVTPEAPTQHAIAPSPAPVIEAVSLGGEPRDPREVVRVDAERQSLEFDVSVASLIAPEDTRVRFRLSVNREWVEVKAGRRVVWPSLPWGTYDVEVIARVADRDWSPPTRLHIVHPRPWYWHPVSWAGFAIATALGTLLLQRIVREYLRRRNTRYLAEIKQRSDDLERHNRALEELARTDALTGLTNRRGFVEDLKTAWSNETNFPLSVLIVDVDDFKRYNDQFGHARGDDCLKTVGRILQTNVRATTDVARLGGEEFVVLVRQAPQTQAHALAERLMAVMNAAAIPHASGTHHPIVTFSVGCATADQGRHGGPEALMERADAAMYQAKRAGRNAVRVAS